MNARHDRLYAARRAELIERLAGNERMARQRAEELVAAWEESPAATGLERLSPNYWREAVQWIHAQLGPPPPDV